MMSMTGWGRFLSMARIGHPTQGSESPLRWASAYDCLLMAGRVLARNEATYIRMCKCPINAICSALTSK